MKRKNNLDEMQELTLLKIEHNGCWLAFWLLAVSMILQRIFWGDNIQNVVGEWIVFMILALYLAIACVRKGIWDRHLHMNTRTNVLLSLVAALFVGVLNTILFFRQSGRIAGAIAASLVTAAITFLLCLGAVTFAMKQTKKRQEKLNREPEE